MKIAPRKQLPLPLLAASGLPSNWLSPSWEVVLTAQKRVEPLQDTPLSEAA